MRLTAATLGLSLVAAIGAAAALAPPREPVDDDAPTAAPAPATSTASRTVVVEARYRGRTAAAWAARYRRRTRQLFAAQRHYRHRTRQLQATRARSTMLHRELLHRPTVVEAINLSCAVYGWCSTLWRKAECETGGTFSPTAQNPSGAAGLFQFLPSTWATTPFARFSIWSPYANALAAGWMHDRGRGGEWACR